MIHPLSSWLNALVFLARSAWLSCTSRDYPGAYRDRGPGFRALSYTERLVVWNGEHDAAASAARARAAAEAGAKEAALAQRRASEEARRLDIAQFLADNPGVDIGSLRPGVFPGYTYLPGRECEFCRGDRDGLRCLMSPECLFRYRAGFFTRQGGVCPWCGGPLPGDLGMTRERGVVRADVAIDHIIPLTRGGPDAEWNKQLLHKKCNTSKGNRVTDSALMLASEHGAEVLDFVAAYWPPCPMPQDAVVHLLTPLRFGADRVLRTALSGIGGGFRALCGHRFDWDWFPVHGSPPAVTCPRCREHRERLGPGNAPACPASCCAS